jgi:hypothetical protein
MRYHAERGNDQTGNLLWELACLRWRQLPHNQVDNLLDGRDVNPVFLSRLQVELPLDLHNEAGQIVINDREVMDEIRVLRHLASLDKANDVDEQLNHFFGDLSSHKTKFLFATYEQDLNCLVEVSVWRKRNQKNPMFQQDSTY